MNNSERARKLLELRKNGVTVSSGFVSMKGRMIFRLFLIVVSLIFYYVTDGAPAFILIVGFALGMFVQDFSWFQAVAKSWSFTKSVINWSEVERIDKNNS